LRPTAAILQYPARTFLPARIAGFSRFRLTAITPKLPFNSQAVLPFNKTNTWGVRRRSRE
jgi:hypothetical protein